MADISGYLNNIRNAASGETVRDAIIQCLNKINSDNPTKTKPLNVTANGTYTSDTGYAYNPVTVNVPSGGSSSYTFEELEVTENGEYEPEEENVMFNKVTVEVPQFAKDLMESFTITQNGEYEALLDGYDGYAKVIVNVNEATGDGPFTVQFYDAEKRLIATETVNKYGSASCRLLDGTEIGGQYYKGWNPSPTNVTRDLKCYPIYGDYIINPGEISDSWETIVADGGAHYDIGAFKSIVFDVPATTIEHYVKEGFYYDYNGIHYIPTNAFSVAMDVVKVAEGEDGSSSTWLSTGCINPVINSVYGIPGVYGYTMGTDGNRPVYYLGNGFAQIAYKPYSIFYNQDWSNSIIREFLNSYFLYYLPLPLQTAIKQVNKSYRGINTSSGSDLTLVEKTSLDKLWVPSIKELYSQITSNVNPDKQLSGFSNRYATINSFKENTGIDYSAIYAPTYSNTGDRSFALRTAALPSDTSKGADFLVTCRNDPVIEICPAIPSNYYGGQANHYCCNWFPFGFCL